MPSAHAFDMRITSDIHMPDQHLPMETMKVCAVTMTEDLQEDDGSSDESDNDEREDHSKTGVSQQRITQNAKFKALSVPESIQSEHTYKNANIYQVLHSVLIQAPSTMSV